MSWYTTCRRLQLVPQLYRNSTYTRTVTGELVDTKKCRVRSRYDSGVTSQQYQCPFSNPCIVGRSACARSRFHRQYSSNADQEKMSWMLHKYLFLKKWKLPVFLTSLTLCMLWAPYAVVPYYERLCQLVGIGGTVQIKEKIEETIARHSEIGTVTSREIVVQFNADVSDGMQWKFVPTQTEVRVKPGESVLAFYTAENQSSEPITGISTYNVTPMKAAKYFTKVQCFCFETQMLAPGEQIDMPVFFYIDPEFETDSKMVGINNIILSYTFFKSSEDAN